MSARAVLAWTLILVATSCAGRPEPPPPTTCPVPPKYGPETLRLAAAREHLVQCEAPDFWALIPYYVPQHNGSSCSLATLTIVLNGARSGEELAASETLFVQDAVLERTGSALWQAAVAEGGEGLTLDQLAGVARACLAAHGFPASRVEVVHADDAGAGSAFHEALVENERSAEDFLVLNFLQGIAVGDPEGNYGHVSPVGAYDAVHRRVLILDVDREWYEPYWVPEATVFAAMATIDPASGRTRGFLRIRPAR